MPVIIIAFELSSWLLLFLIAFTITRREVIYIYERLQAFTIAVLLSRADKKGITII